MDPRRLYELIDACRPHSDDAADLELDRVASELGQSAEAQLLLERSQRLDAAIGDAFRRVRPPEGLAERLLASLEAAQLTRPEARSAVGLPVSAAPAEQAALVDQSELANGPALKTQTGRLGGRRTWLTVAGLTTLAASLIWLLAWNTAARLPTTGPEILTAVERWNVALDESQWRAGESAPLTRLPDRTGLRLAIRRWQPLSNGRVVCYEFADSARLFVFRPASRPDLPSQPPPGYPLGNWHVGAWQTDGLVYVLAVTDLDEPAEAFYRRLIARRGAAA